MKTFCIIEVGPGAPIYGSMDTPESCLEHHRIAQRRLGFSAREDLDVWEGDPRGEGPDAPRKVGIYSETYGLQKYPNLKPYTVKTYVSDKGVIFDVTDEEGLLVLEGYVEGPRKSPRAYSTLGLSKVTDEAPFLAEAERQCRDGEVR